MLVNEERERRFFLSLVASKRLNEKERKKNLFSRLKVNTLKIKFNG